MLYLVSIPIGCFDDLTQRARRVLAECDVIVGEERKPLQQLLRRLDLADKETLLYNEHSNKRDVQAILDLLIEGKTLAYVSDAGTPAVADPGAELVRACREQLIEVVPVPGVSSITAALTVSGFRIHRFKYLGFIPRDTHERRRFIEDLRREEVTTVLMDTPYRFRKVLEECTAILPDRRIAVAGNLTMPDEDVLRGLPADVMREAIQKKYEKGEFVLVVEGQTKKSLKDQE